MKTSALLLPCIMTASININASDEHPAGLDDLRWKNRVFLVYVQEPETSEALARLEELEAEIEDRDIAWFVLGGSRMHTNYPGTLEDGLQSQILSRYFTPAPGETTLLLIGKDGGLKSRSTRLGFEEAFGLIDQMPMRVEEMRNKSGGAD
jgi:hypothetical protein